ncbi:hypothetical protein CATYP_10690 (plasmid) [Corynebacterium atypicum]|uniref:Uncharacterized protein n=1 Tax=Corynebacterium atypicum TaxID=191610 RepID=A0ABM5QPT3_9CORY|nr:hypothetical protein [Corynebacterium atypicum]AIG64791.1 hypothetical protein CATYP_09760 [Corynebacterium atypicum]AIG64933.1 hypothetical protein CATYP_10690 [Corynebacterium atypicum]
MTQHRLKLHIAKHIPDDPGIVGTRTVTLRGRIMRKLLGRKQRVTIVVPGNSVKQIDIAETDDDLMALADAAGVTREGGDAA